MFTLRPDFDRVLTETQEMTPGEPGEWLERPPADAHHLSRSIPLPGDRPLDHYAFGLLDWDIHRGAGFRVTSDGPAGVGFTVVLGLRLGPLWLLAPCRVIQMVNTEHEVGFTYATLPGHPEAGAESFRFVKDADGSRFEVNAVSRQAFWGARLLPAVARRVQAVITDRYLDAGRGLAGG